MFIIIHYTIDINYRYKTSNITYLPMKNPATSYVAATFHPTIGQRAHQSLSNAVTPELGMIPPRIRVNAGLHIAKGINQQTNIAGFIRPSTNRPSQHSPKTHPYLHAAKQSLHSPMKKARTTRDNPKHLMSTTQAHNANLSCSWP